MGRSTPQCENIYSLFVSMIYEGRSKRFSVLTLVVILSDYELALGLAHRGTSVFQCDKNGNIFLQADHQSSWLQVLCIATPPATGPNVVQNPKRALDFSYFRYD